MKTLQGLRFLPPHILNVSFISFCCTVPLLISLMLNMLNRGSLKRWKCLCRQGIDKGELARRPGTSGWKSRMNAKFHVRNPTWNRTLESMLIIRCLNKKYISSKYSRKPYRGHNRSQWLQPRSMNYLNQAPLGYKKKMRQTAPDQKTSYQKNLM